MHIGGFLARIQKNQENSSAHSTYLTHEKGMSVVRMGCEMDKGK